MRVLCTVLALFQICNSGEATHCNDTMYVEYCNATYCPTTCSQCEPGYACLDGRRSICLPGSYSDGTLGKPGSSLY